ncbi:hypothetical protein CK203_045693 [Vitis vinifera]|uniref:Uncharacterized protein n=1 Tax=Vitis vinifera TaxID=29760 RepID=A0A438HQ26_VITVI|nr:hypothetical protein CK203_045693 [Vitis vinifera]
MTNTHRRRNQLTRVKVNGRWFTEESEIKEEVSRAFQGLLVDPGDWKLSIDGLVFERLEELDVEGLEKPFSRRRFLVRYQVFAGENASKGGGAVDVFVLVLMWFEAISGLRVNLEKIELIPVGRVENVKELADEFGYKVGKLPSTYLGMPLGAPFKSVAAWDGIEERFRKRLTMWKRQYISKGGRITLIRSTLSNFSIYFMSIFQLPRVVRMRLEQIQKDFLWVVGLLSKNRT